MNEKEIKLKLEKIMKLMEKIEYGFKDKNGNNIIDFDEEKWEREFSEFYYLQTPEELLESKCGVCWDQVELERKLFKSEGIKTKTFFIYLIDNDMLPSHTFLTFENDNKYFWFEHSWGNFKGIHKYETENELLKDVVRKFKTSHNEIKYDAKMYVYQYEMPSCHIKCDDFYKYIETQKQIEI